MRESQQTDQPSHPQVQNQGDMGAHLNIHCIYALLEHVKETNLHGDPKQQNLYDT